MGETGYPLGREREPIPIIVLRQAFHESGLSVRELARRLKVHHSSVGRKVSGWKAHQYTQNAAGEVVDYDARFISVRADTAIRYIQAMGLDPADYLSRPFREFDVARANESVTSNRGSDAPKEGPDAV